MIDFCDEEVCEIKMWFRHIEFTNPLNDPTVDLVSEVKFIAEKVMKITDVYNQHSHFSVNMNPVVPVERMPEDKYPGVQGISAYAPPPQTILPNLPTNIIYKSDGKETKACIQLPFPKMKFGNFIPLECMFCSCLKKYNIKNELVVIEATDVLLGGGNSGKAL